MNQAEMLFQRILADPQAEIEALVARGDSEDTWLDFKAYIPKDGPETLKRYFSEAVSGFSNTDGGLIVWGVRTEKKDDGERACGWALVPTPEWVASTLDNEIAKATFPANPRVRNIWVILDETANAGVVVTYVPLSPLRPLQREGKGKGFKMRAGAAFIDLPYQVLAGMFGRAPSPDVRASLSLHAHFGRRDRAMGLTVLRRQAETLDLDLALYFENLTAVAAKEAFISTIVGAGLPLLNSSSGPLDGRWNVFAPANQIGAARRLTTATVDAQSFIVPFERCPVFQVQLKLPMNAGALHDRSQEIYLEVTAGASGAIPHRLSVSMGIQSIEALASKIEETSRPIEVSWEALSAFGESNLR